MRGEPVEKQFQTSDIRLTYFEWGNADDPVILLIHATGMHARTWDKTVAALPEGYRVIAVDQRGHGRSEKKGYINDWRVVANDIAELVVGLGLRDVIGVGHSMGGHCLSQVAARLPGVFKRLLLIDPVMVPPEAYLHNHWEGIIDPKDSPMARRRNEWSTWEEMYEHLNKRYPFSAWKPEVLQDYCRYGLLPRADGEGLELACPPAIEASIYMSSRSANIYDITPKVNVPVVILRAKERAHGHSEKIDFSSSPTWTELWKQFPNARDVHLPDITHFIPMEDPELTARFIVDPDATA